jgi:hypothetical protein
MTGACETHQQTMVLARPAMRRIPRQLHAMDRAPRKYLLTVFTGKPLRGWGWSWLSCGAVGHDVVAENIAVS